MTRHVARFEVPRFAIAAVLCVLLLAACSSGASGSTEQSPPPSVSASASLALVAIGDSIPLNPPDHCPGCVGFVTQYGNALSDATGRPVDTHNLSSGTGLTLPGLLAELGNLEDDLKGADAIVVGIAHNSFPLNDEAPCGSTFDETTNTIEDWSKVDQECADDAIEKYRPMYDELFSTIAGWREGRPTILRTINRYNDWIGWEPGHLTADQEQRTVLLTDAWSAMICDSASANGFTCADIYHAFNGPDGTKASGDLLAPDYIHPSQKGNDLITSVLVEGGFAPIA